MSDIIPGCEPVSHDGGPVGVLVLHGFTGNPSSVRPLVDAMVAAGHTVECPLLPGHGTRIEDMLPTSWSDWSAEAEAALGRLAARTERQVVAGLSMGGSLTVWLALHHPELAGIICVNPAVAADPAMVEAVSAMAEAGEEIMPAIGSDVADPDVVELAYPGTPIRPLLSLFEVAGSLGPRLREVQCPLLLFTSPEDHVVPPGDSDLLASSVSGPVERVSCDRSYHVATIDFDRDLIARRSVEFVARVTA
jgi:carboxylesterase